MRSRLRTVWAAASLTVACIVTAPSSLFSPTLAPTLQAQAAPAVTNAPLPGVDTLLDARAKTVSSRLRCPVCQGESIQDSPAELAAQMKSLVREQLASGRSEAQVFDYFTAKYGQWILLEPKAEGINLLVYWLPVLFLILGGGGIAVAVKRWTRPVSVETPPPSI